MSPVSVHFGKIITCRQKPQTDIRQRKLHKSTFGLDWRDTEKSDVFRPYARGIHHADSAGHNMPSGAISAQLDDVEDIAQHRPMQQDDIRRHWLYLDPKAVAQHMRAKRTAIVGGLQNCQSFNAAFYGVAICKSQRAPGPRRACPEHGQMVSDIVASAQSLDCQSSGMALSRRYISLVVPQKIDRQLRLIQQLSFVEFQDSDYRFQDLNHAVVMVCIGMRKNLCWKRSWE
ncbi:hypothetical protein WNZ14_17355 [Hoeflea sp. AS60]|uniref:hypothetical protein n=1 Tax=Hoeflea sp. AS60 TaxID=3135780 RepID=UPI00317D7DE8